MSETLLIAKKLKIALGLAALTFIFLFGFASQTETNIGVNPVAADENSVWAANMSGCIASGNYNCFSGGTCGDNNFHRENDGSIPGGKRLHTCRDEQTCSAYGDFYGLNSSVTYTAYVGARAGSEGARMRFEVRAAGTSCESSGYLYRWTGYVRDYGYTPFGGYSFSGRTSVRLCVRSLIDRDGPYGCPPNYPCSCNPSLRVSRVYLYYNPSYCTWGATIPQPACSQQQGLRGRYYRDYPVGGNRFDGGLKLNRYDSTVNFSWGDYTSPDPSRLGNATCDNYSARWTGYVRLSTSGSWRFATRTDDGVRLWVDLNDDGDFGDAGELRINAWWDQPPTTRYSNWTTLNSGWYRIRMDHYQNTGGAEARLYYQGPGMASASVIPSSNLRSCYAPIGPNLVGEFLELSNGQIVGSGTQSDPYKIQRGTDWIRVRFTPNPSPGGGTLDFKLIRPGGATSTIQNDVNLSGGTWTHQWTSPDPGGLPEDTGYQVWGHFGGFGGWGDSDGYIYFDIVPPANAEYLISANGDIDAQSFCWGQDSGCLLRYYTDGVAPASPNPTILAPTYDELVARYGRENCNWSGSDSFPQSTGVWRRCGNITTPYTGTTFNFNNNRIIVLFVDGNLTIRRRINVPTNSMVVFIVGGQIRFHHDFSGSGDDTVDGVYIAHGNIDTGYTYILGNTPRLIVEGALISTRGTVLLKRKLSDVDNARYPAERIILQPRYYARTVGGNPLATYLGDTQVSWKEVAP